MMANQDENTGCLTPLVKQCWVVSAVLIVLLGQGMGLGWTSSLLPALQAPDSPIKISLDTSSWLVSSLAIACVTSYAISPLLISICGRRIAMMIEVLPGFVGCLLSYFATNVTTLIAGRFLNGLTIGSTGVLGAIVIGEYTSPAYRGVFLNLKTMMLFVGCTIVHILGNYLHWRTVALINSLPYGLALIIVYTWPESPAWLAEKKDYVRCSKYYYWLRGKSKKSTKELEELIASQKQKPFGKRKSILKLSAHFLSTLNEKSFIKPVIIYFFAALLMEASGRHFFPSYALQFIQGITGDKESFYYTICIDIIITGSAFIASVLVVRIRRRTLLFTTGAAAILVLLLACLYLLLQSKDVISKEHNIAPLVLFSLYFILVNLGCSPISLALVGEIFPLEHRPTGTCIAGFMVSLMLFVILKILPFLLLNIKVYGTFAIFGACMSVSLIAMYFMLPETKDKTLQEIENYFNYGTFSKREHSEEEANHNGFLNII